MDAKKFAERVKLLILEVGGQEAAEAKWGVPQSSLSDYKTGKPKFKQIQAIDRIAQGAGVSLEWLIRGNAVVVERRRLLKAIEAIELAAPDFEAAEKAEWVEELYAALGSGAKTERRAVLSIVRRIEQKRGASSGG